MINTSFKRLIFSIHINRGIEILKFEVSLPFKDNRVVNEFILQVSLKYHQSKSMKIQIFGKNKNKKMLKVILKCHKRCHYHGKN